MNRLFFRLHRKRPYLIYNPQTAVFVHIPKTAGGSIRHFCNQNGIYIIGHNLRGQGYEMPAIQYQRMQELWSFCFVRDPATRAFSAFRWLNSGGKVPGDSIDAEKYTMKYGNDFTEFCEQELLTGKALNQLHFLPQHEWLTTADGTIFIDQVFRFENLDGSYEKLKRLFVDTVTHLPKRNSGSINVTNIDKRALEIIQTVYKKDYELFNY